MNKCLILADSQANPRSFPINEIVQLEETYPYIIRNFFNNSTYWQLSFGNITTEQLCSQAASYINHWDPDVIIVHSGLNDCRPEAFTELQKSIINKFSGRILGRVKKYLYNPALIRRRQVYRVPEASFRKTVKKLKLIFPKAKIYWLEICAGPRYEEARPGVNRRMEDYNNIIREIYQDDFIPINGEMLAVDGFNVDNLHWNKHGQSAVAELLMERIRNDFPGKVAK